LTERQKEINEVLNDIETVIQKIEFRISTIQDNIRLAKAHLSQTEALTFLTNAQEQVNKIDFVPIIDTLEGMIKND